MEGMELKPCYHWIFDISMERLIKTRGIQGILKKKNLEEAV